MIEINRPIRIISIIVLIVVLSLAFFSSYDALKIDNLAFVIAIAIDEGTNSDNLEISFQIAKPASMSESSSEKGSTSTINSVEASSIGSAITLMNSYVEKQLNFSHCKLIVFSEAVAAKGISEEIFTLMNNVQIRPSTNVVISKTDAKYYIENSSTNLEILPTTYYEFFPTSSKYTGYVGNSTLGDFFNSLNSTTAEPSAILGGTIYSNVNDIKYYVPKNPQDYGNMKSNESAISGERISENLGLAVFKDERLVGELNCFETACFSIIENRVDSFLITINDPQNNEKYIDLVLYINQSPHKKVKVINNTPYILLNCEFEGRVYSAKREENYLNEDSLKEISNAASKYIELQMYNYLYKTSKKFKSDINGFGKYARSQFLTTQEFNNYNWPENYQNSFFKVNCNVSIKSGYLITET